MQRHIPRARWLATLAVAVLGVGCVPLETYRQTRDELERAKVANEDLVKRYNATLQKLMAKGPEGVPADYAALQGENRQLRDQLQKQRANPEFTREQIEKVGANEEEGGMALGEALLFAEGSAKLKTEAFRVLDSLVTILRSEYPDEKIIIEGHTDNQPVEKVKQLFPYNMDLGYHRARAVFEYLSKHGIPESRLIVHSYSFNKPVNPSAVDTKDGRRENRRVVVRRGGTQI